MRNTWRWGLVLFPLSALWLATGPMVPTLPRSVAMGALLVVIVGLAWSEVRR